MHQARCNKRLTPHAARPITGRRCRSTRFRAGAITRQKRPDGMILPRGQGWYRYEMLWGDQVELVGYRAGTRASIRRYLVEGLVARANADHVPGRKRGGAAAAVSGWQRNLIDQRRIRAALSA